MIKNKNANQTFFIFGLIAFSLTLTGCFQPGKKISADNAGQAAANEQQKAANNQALEHQYEISVPTILKPYWQNNDVADLKAEILALTVPVKYLDLHLNLVMALENIEQGRAGSDQAKIQAGVDKINKLAADYNWLKSNN